MKIELEFKTDGVVLNPHWEFKAMILPTLHLATTPLSQNSCIPWQYIVDYTNKRRGVILGKKEIKDKYLVGKHNMEFSVDKIDVMQMRKTLLLNVSLSQHLFSSSVTVF